MSGVTLIKGGTVVNADREWKADVLIKGETIAEVGENLAAPEGATVIDAAGKYVLPGGIDPHTHMALPFMGTTAIDDWTKGTGAALAGGTTTIIDFVIPSPGQSLLKAYDWWMDNAKQARCDYGFHVAVTWFSDQVREEMGILAHERGVSSFKHFMAYKGSLMLDDEALVNSFTRAKELGCLSTVHAENGELVARGQQRMLELGITGPEGHPQSRPPEVEGEATNRAVEVADYLNTPVYIVHVSCKEAADVVSRARRNGQRVYGEALAGHLTIDDSVYYNKDWRFAAAHVMSPPFRAKPHQAALWKALQAGDLQTTATDNCTFCAEQKAMGKDDFSKIPNGTNGVQDRMSVLWDQGVRTGRLSRTEYVAATSTSAAQIFNLYPKKGVIAAGSDADIVVFDPNASRTISAETHHHAVDFNIWEGWTVTGVVDTTLLRGKVVYTSAEDKITAEAGYGQFLARPTYGSAFDGIKERDAVRKPIKVERE